MLGAVATHNSLFPTQPIDEDKILAPGSLFDQIQLRSAATVGKVKLLLPPRQSRGNSHRNSRPLWRRGASRVSSDRRRSNPQRTVKAEYRSSDIQVPVRSGIVYERFPVADVRRKHGVDDAALSP